MSGVMPMKALSDDQRKMAFVKRGILIPKGSCCCCDHLLNEHLNYASLGAIVSSLSDCLVLDSEGVNDLLNDFRYITQISKTFSFDDPNCLKDEAYYYITGLKKSISTGLCNT